MEKYVYSTGKSAGAGDQMKTVLYNRGMYQALLTTEAIRKAQEIHGTANITPAMMRDGMEALAIDEARMTELGMPAFGPEFMVTCENHGGSGIAKIQQWDAASKTWTVVTDWIASDRDVIDPLIAEDSAAYAAENNIAERCN